MHQEDNLGKSFTPFSSLQWKWVQNKIGHCWFSWRKTIIHEHQK